MARKPDEPEHRIAEWRHSMGWSQEELAERAGVSHSTISRVENGRVRPRAQLLDKLSKAFGLPRSMLLDVNPDTSPTGTAELFRIFVEMDGDARAQLIGIAKAVAAHKKP